MADKQGEQRKASNGEAAGENASPTCGVIMPISATTTFPESHWVRVQSLVHRAIVSAGFAPANVWENSSKDRISERIVGSIFAHPVAVIDISDLNPNVMLELGLRLASKKPSIVISSSASDIPFDIRDFEVLLYPVDLNIIDMEIFLEKLKEYIFDRYNSSKNGTYTPFLANLVVDVLSPSEREVPIDKLILSRLDDLDRRISEGNRKSELSGAVRIGGGRVSASQYVTINKSNVENLRSHLSEMFGAYSLKSIGSENDEQYFDIGVANTLGRPAATTLMLNDAIVAAGGRTGAPSKFVDRIGSN